MSRILLFLVLIVAVSSCVPYKNIIYLQDGNVKGDTIKRQIVRYKVQPMDRLTIQVRSYDPEVTSFFNLSQGTNNQGGQSGQAAGGRGSLSYLVSDSGYIEMPMLPKIYVAGLSVQQITDTVQTLIRSQVSDAYVIVRLAEYKVVLFGKLGEKIITSNDDQINIFEVVAQAGLTRFSSRKDIQLIRQKGDQYILTKLDITKKDIMTSEYFYLQPNDMVYVRPVKLENFLDNLSSVSRVIGLTSILYVFQRLIVSI